MNKYENLDTVAFGLRRLCTKCQYRVPIEVKLGNLSLEDICRDLAESISDQQTKDGWKDGYCPECADQYADELHAIHNADADPSE